MGTRRPGYGMVALATLSVTLIGLAATANATTMRRASVEELARASHSVARGQIVSATAERRVINGRDGIYTSVSMRVDAWWLGPGGETVDFVVHGGRVGNDIARVHGQAVFAPGERVVVFLLRGGDVLWPTGMSQGKWRIDGGGVVSAADPTALEAHGAPMSEPPEAMSLAELEARVRAATRGD